MDEVTPDRSPSDGNPRSGESMAWSAIATLVGGPLTWGGIGWFIDRWLDTGRAFTASGVIIGFITGIYIVYVRYGR